MKDKDIVGKRFTLQSEEYLVVDTRNIAGETMVYADRTASGKGPGRAAFRLSDVESKLAEHEAA